MDHNKIALSGGVDIVDSTGKVVSNVPYGTSEAAAALNDKKLYSDGNGGFTSKIPTAYADFNNAGDIVIHAPKAILEMKSFKENVLENSALSQLSRAYKIDPNYKFPDPEDDSKTITLSEQMEKLNDGLKQYTETAQGLLDESDRIALRYGLLPHQKLSLDNMVAAMSIASGDQDRQVIPEDVLKRYGNFFENLPSWDPETRSAAKGEILRSFFSYDKEKRTELLARYAFSRFLAEDSSIVRNLTESEEGKNELVERMAFERFLDSNDAVAETMTGINRKVADAVFNELLSFAGHFSSGIMSFISGLSFLTSASVREVSGNDDFELAVGEWFATNAVQLEQAVDFWRDESDHLDKGTAVVGEVFGTLGNLGAILISEGFVGELIYTAVTPLRTASEVLEFAGKHSKEIEAGAKFAMRALPTAKAAQIAIDASRLLKAGIKVVEFLAEVIVDAAVDNPDLMVEIYRGEDADQHIKDVLMEEAAFNGFGMAAGLTLSKGLTKFSTTRVGKMLNAWFAVLNAKVQTKFSDLFNNLRVGKAETSIVEKYAAKAEGAEAAGKTLLRDKFRRLEASAAIKQELQDARKVLAGLPLADVDAIAEQVSRIKTFEAAYDIAAQGGKQTLSAILGSDRIIRESNEAVSNALKDVLKQQRISHLAAAAGKYGSSGLSAIGTEYISASYRLELASRAFADTTSTLHAQATKALPVYQEQVANLVRQMTPEYKAALDIYASKVKVFYNNMTNFATANGLLSEKIIEGYRKTGLFADGNYMRVVVENDVPRIRMERADGLIANNNILDIKHLQLPAEAQKFVDPEVVRYWYGLEIAQAWNAKELAESALAATGATTTVLATDKELRAAKDIKMQSKPIVDAIKSKAKDFVASVDESFKLGDIRELNLKRSTATTKAIVAKQTQAKITALYKQAAVGALPAEEMANLFKEAGYTSGSALDDLLVRFNGDESLFREWYKSANKSVKDWVKAQRDAYIVETVFDGSDDVLKVADKTAKEFNTVTFSDFQALAAMDGFKRGFDNQMFMVEPKLANNKRVIDLANNIEQAGSYVEGLTEAKNKAETAAKEMNVSKVAYKQAKDAAKESIKGALDNYVSMIMGNKTVANNAYAIAKYSGADPETVARFMVLEQLQKKANLDAVHQAIYKKVTADVPSKATKAQINAYAASYNDAVDALLKDEFNNARLALDEVGSTIIDKKKWADEIKALQKKIAGAASVDNVIKMSDGHGGIQLVQVNPNLAFLYNYRPHRTVATDIISRFNRMTSKLFRFGTTTISSKSFVNQLLRDSGNAYFMGNAWRSISESADNLVDVFGERIVRELKAFQPENYQAIVSSLTKEGAAVTTENIAREAVKDMQAFGEAISPAATETEIYRRAGKASDSAFERMQTQTRNVADKLDDIFNGKRERYLRNRVFMNGLNEAMEQGHSFAEARKIATNLMQNATTNFSRSLMMLDSVAENVPYIRSAINGTTSFWRMWSLDPVGVTGRIMGGLYIPYVYLIGQSLSDKENIEIYRKIPEYEKRDSLVFVVRGQKVMIPIPQEIGKFMAPFRQFVEYLYDANPNNFWELMANDVLGLSPVDLTGFSTIDMNVMTSDPTIMDRLTRGTTRVISQLMPVPVKAAYIYATGVDPYTGKRIANTSWTYRDPETGEEVPMGYNQGRLAESVARAFQHDNPAVVSAVLSAIFGETGEDVLDTIVGISQLVTGEDNGNIISVVGDSLVVPQVGNAVRVFYGEEYDRIQSLWRQSIRELEIKKDAITESKEWKELQSQLSQATSEKAIATIRAKRQTMIENYVKEVTDTVKRLTSEYNGTFDRSKYASVLQLLNFSTNVDFDISNAHLRELASESYYAGRNQAIRTLQEMGIQGVTDNSIFGYLKQNSDGSVDIRYNKPTAILDIANTVWGAQDIELANLKAALDDAGLTTSERYRGYQEAKTKAEKNAFKKEWNTKVIEAIAPYVQRVGVDEVLNHSTIIDYLDNIIYVNNPYKAKDYIKQIFKG